jgi:DNA-directed RNA polymerase subunit M/transcription elongation factor TFIIS
MAGYPETGPVAAAQRELRRRRSAPAGRLVTAVEAAQRGVPQTAVERTCPTCGEKHAVELAENDRWLAAGEAAPECPACESLMAMHFPPD